MDNLSGSENLKNLPGLKNRIRRFFAQEFFKNPIVHWTSIAGAFLNLANWVLLAVFIRPSDYLILHYNVYFGYDVVGDWRQVFFIPSLGLVFLLINFFLACRFFRKRERIASYILLLASIMAEIGLIIASVGVVIVNY